ncbi:MAG: N-succinylarginine dihydrolase [Maricaulaceae bacterium]
MSVELNIDGLVGPTHNYAGLSYGNIASKNNKGVISNPRAAALQGLNKMRTLMNMGVPQALMPPHERPFLPMLRQLGFEGKSNNIVRDAWKSSPELMSNLCSASSMWTANAATVSPSAHCYDGRVNFTPANLAAMPHRSIEPSTTRRILKTIFRNEDFFKVHDPLPSNSIFGDEGAANHNVLCGHHGRQGIEIFVYGQRSLDSSENKTTFPGRQTLEASEAVARSHGISNHSKYFIKQNPSAIDAGAFHNDVVCVVNGPVMFYHEQAFAGGSDFKADLRTRAQQYGFDPIFLEASQAEMSLEDAVKSYVFNSQIVTRTDGMMSIVLPGEAENNKAASRFVDKCIAGNNPIEEAVYLDLRESMQNGGGPACLRLRVPLTKTELSNVHQPILMNHERLNVLEAWVSRHYRDRLYPSDLADPALVSETQQALDELSKILEIGSFYHFQFDGEPHWSEYV